MALTSSKSLIWLNFLTKKNKYIVKHFWTSVKVRMKKLIITPQMFKAKTDGNISIWAFNWGDFSKPLQDTSPVKHLLNTQNQTFDFFKSEGKGSSLAPLYPVYYEFDKSCGEVYFDLLGFGLPLFRWTRREGCPVHCGKQGRRTQMFSYEPFTAILEVPEVSPEVVWLLWVVGEALGTTSAPLKAQKPAKTS